jgi:hypothetical protein
MKVTQLFAYIALVTSAANAASIPEARAISLIEDRLGALARSADVLTPDHSLERRKGGGGRGGGSSGGSGGSGGGRSSGSSGNSGSSSRTSTNSAAGGSTRSGSGAPRTYGGGYYGGGAGVPYTAGKKTPKGLIAAPLLLGASLLLIMPGLWLYSVYPYHFSYVSSEPLSKNFLLTNSETLTDSTTSPMSIKPAPTEQTNHSRLPVCVKSTVHAAATKTRTRSI